MKKHYFLLLLLSIFCLPAIAQVTITLPSIKDNAIYSENVNNSSGIGMLYAGQTCSNNQRRSFIQFNPSTIPNGATITAVTLTMTSNNVSAGSAGGELFTIYGLATNFGEGTSTGGGSGSAAMPNDATWNANMFGTSLWTNPGGDFSFLPVTTLNLPNTTGAHVFPSSSIFVSVLNSWINTPSNNFGLMLAGEVSSTCTARRFDSKDQGTNPPILTVTYTPCAPTSSTDVQTQCDTYSWIDGNTYISSNNTATHTLTNAAGCDSIVTLDLTITNSTSSTDVQSACTSYTWIDGNTYTASNNTATHTINNAVGCDSVITLNLSIDNASSGTDILSSCGPITWIDGNTYAASNSTATFTLTNAAGCDSVVSLNFTLGGNFTSTDVQEACDSYTWIDGNTYTASNNTAMHTVNGPGCDTLYTLNLTINKSTSSTDVQTACDTYIWIDGNTYTASNSTATHTITNAAGCDSVVTLNLTISNSSSSTDVQTSCGDYTWIDGNTYTTSNNTATTSFVNAAGCDSIVTLNLTVTEIDLNMDLTTSATSTTIMSSTPGASYQWLDCNNGSAEISGETSQSFSPATIGSYAVVITLNNCVDTTDCVDITSVGISNPYIENQVSIYPNPNVGLVQLDFGNLSNASFKLFNTLGQIVASENLMNLNTHQIELKGEAGIYFIEVTAEGKQAYFKIVKK